MGNKVGLLVTYRSGAVERVEGVSDWILEEGQLQINPGGMVRFDVVLVEELGSGAVADVAAGVEPDVERPEVEGGEVTLWVKQANGDVMEVRCEEWKMDQKYGVKAYGKVHGRRAVVGQFAQVVSVKVSEWEDESSEKADRLPTSAEFEAEAAKERKMREELSNAPVGGFAWAMGRLWEGRSVKRSGWPKCHLGIYSGTSGNTLIQMFDEGRNSHYAPTYADAVATDWEVAN